MLSLKPEEKHHALSRKWTVWVHSNRKDWSRKSYQPILQFETIEHFWAIYDKIPWSIATFYVMADDHFPAWEDHPKGCRVVVSSCKLGMKKTCLEFLLSLLGGLWETEVLGLEIQPKAHKVNYKVWLNEVTSTSTLPEIPTIKWKDAFVNENA